MQWTVKNTELFSCFCFFFYLVVVIVFYLFHSLQTFWVLCLLILNRTERFLMNKIIRKLWLRNFEDCFFSSTLLYNVNELLNLKVQCMWSSKYITEKDSEKENSISEELSIIRDCRSHSMAGIFSSQKEIL